MKIGDKYITNDEKRVYGIKESMGSKVLTLNGRPMPQTINKSEDYYQGYKNGMEVAINIINNGKPEKFGMRNYD